MFELVQEHGHLKKDTFNAGHVTGLENRKVNSLREIRKAARVERLRTSVAIM